LDQVTSISDQFFDLPETDKKRYEMGKTVYHGWIPSEVEGLVCSAWLNYKMYNTSSSSVITGL